MNCPKCGHVQTGEQECERRGVIFALLQKKEEDQALSGQAERKIFAAPGRLRGLRAGCLPCPFRRVRWNSPRILRIYETAGG